MNTRPFAALGLSVVMSYALLIPDVLSASASPHRSNNDIEGSIPFGEVADQFAKEQPFGFETDGATAFRTLLDRGHVQLPLGLFELRFPTNSLGSTQHLGTLKDSILAVAEAQDIWLHWVKGVPVKKSIPETRGLKELKKWVSGWKPRDFSNLGFDWSGDQSLDLRDVLEAGSETRAFLEAFALLMRETTYLESSRAPQTVELVLTPTREQFVGLACFVGKHITEARSFLWNPTITTWTDFKWEQTQVLALEYADQAGSIKSGLSMNAREKTGLLQHVVHHSMIQILDNLYGEFLDPAVQSGLATNVPIVMFKQNNARVGGSGAGSKTTGRSVFVVGGNSSGGRLPPVNADSRWRQEKGKDYFLKAVKRGLKDGRKKSDGVAGFWVALKTDESLETFPVKAPFVGSQPGSEDMGEAFRSDAMEFFRAYSSAFVYWLNAQKLESDAKSSEQAFGQLLSQAAIAARRGETLSFESVVESVYGLAFTQLETSADSVEGRFLRAMSR